MANNVNSWINIIGNEAANAKFDELTSNLDLLNKKYDYADTRTVSEGFFGSTDTLAHDDKRLGGAKWAYIEEAYSGQIALVSGWDPAFGLGKVVCEILSEADTDVIVTMRFEDEMPNFVGASAWSLKGKTVLRSDCWQATDMYEFIDFNDLLELNEDEAEDYRSWDDVNEMQEECLERAKSNLAANKYESFMEGYRARPD